jgi:apolipoprotein N-acyltransferase
MVRTLAIVAGVALALSFPEYGHPAFGWVALAPLLVALMSPAVGRARQACVLGLLTGVVYFAGTVYWTSGVMARYGGISLPLSIAIAGLLVAYLALFPAAFAVIFHRLFRHVGTRALWLAPAIWVATEYGRLALFGGFPWVLLGYSQVFVLPVAQLASLTGVFGVSGLLAAASASLAGAVMIRGRQRWLAPAAMAMLVGSLAGWGTWRAARNDLTRQGRPLRVGIVQGNVAQNEKWDATRAQAIFERYLRLSRQTIQQGARLVLWPESATPFYFSYGVETEVVRDLARSSGVALLIGSDQWEQGTPSKVFNAAFLVGPDGRTRGVYRKVHLVPFGEYVPLPRLLFFAKPLVEAVSDFAPGVTVNTLPVGDARITTAICYEIVYPALVREGVHNGSELLTTITNDAWFGRSSAPSQHFAMAAMRAIEQGRYLVRAANTGISGVVDPYGRVLLASDLFVEGAWTVDVRLLRAQTVYARLGDLAAWVSLAVTALALTMTARRI